MTSRLLVLPSLCAALALSCGSDSRSEPVTPLATGDSISQPAASEEPGSPAAGEKPADPGAAPPAPAKGTIGAALSGARSVTLRRGLGKPTAEKTLTDAASIAALVQAIGPDQAATDGAPRCPPDVSAVFKDEGGHELAMLSLFCSGKVNQTAGYRSASQSGSVLLSDVAAVEKTLVDAGVWAAAAGASGSVRCGVGGTPIAGDWTNCKGVVGGPCCYQTAAQACSGAGCPAGKCALAKSRPPKATCSK
jgi:hypothetical protein